MYAITPKGIGKPVGMRSIQPDWALVDGETFTVDDWTEDMVLAEDGVSLRLPTSAEDLTEAKASRITEILDESDFRARAEESTDMAVRGMLLSDTRHDRMLNPAELLERAAIQEAGARMKGVRAAADAAITAVGNAGNIVAVDAITPNWPP